MQLTQTNDHLLSLAAQIVSAHVGHNPTPSNALPSLIREVYETLASVTPAPGSNHNHSHEPMVEPARASGRPAARSHAVAADHLVCLEDGLSMKMLKRHLITVHGLTPDQYRAKWGLPSDYPMVAANYAKLRSNLAKESGLGLRPEARAKRGRY